MKKSSRTIGLLVGMVSAGAMMAAAPTVFAAVTWAGAWSGEQPKGTPSYCDGGWTGEFLGGSEINGNDAGMAVAWCSSGGPNPVQTCGSQPGFSFYVRSRGRDTGTNTYDTTPGTAGPTIGSAAGGLSLEYHQCQKGYQPI